MIRQGAIAVWNRRLRSGGRGGRSGSGIIRCGRIGMYGRTPLKSDRALTGLRCLCRTRAAKWEDEGAVRGRLFFIDITACADAGKCGSQDENGVTMMHFLIHRARIRGGLFAKFYAISKHHSLGGAQTGRPTPLLIRRCRDHYEAANNRR